ncbi:hypothetical protein RDE2_50410 (plasmid) [Rhodococcus sp. RDE2]|nr:hypothetical protein RDE2_50410 [Rhodococcus sp. RDE2]
MPGCAHSPSSNPTADASRLGRSSPPRFPSPTLGPANGGESEFGLTLEGRTLHWEVPQNNHARDHAAVTGLYQAALTYLNDVTWTRGTGGVIVGNDEYNRDTTYEGGGGNYVTHRFGPAGQ